MAGSGGSRLSGNDADRDERPLVLLVRVPTKSIALALIAAVRIATPASTSTAAQEPQAVPSMPGVSAHRIGAGLDAPPPEGRLRLDAALPVATFRTSVEQRVYVMTFQEWMRKEFTLTTLQRQSQDWSSRCCGIDLLALIDSLDKKLKRREERKIREQVLRELVALEAAAKR